MLYFVSVLYFYSFNIINMDLKELFNVQDLPEQISSGVHANILSYIVYHPCTSSEIAFILDRGNDAEILKLVSTHFVDPLFHAFIVKRGHTVEIKALLEKPNDLSVSAITELFLRNVDEEIKLFWEHRAKWRNSQVPLSILMKRNNISEIIAECSMRSLNDDDMVAIVECIRKDNDFSEKLLLKLLSDLKN